MHLGCDNGFDGWRRKYRGRQNIGKCRKRMKGNGRGKKKNKKRQRERNKEGEKKTMLCCS